MGGVGDCESPVHEARAGGPARLWQTLQPLKSRIDALKLRPTSVQSATVPCRVQQSVAFRRCPAPTPKIQIIAILSCSRAQEYRPLTEAEVVEGERDALLLNLILVFPGNQSVTGIHAADDDIEPRGAQHHPPAITLEKPFALQQADGDSRLLLDEPKHLYHPGPAPCIDVLSHWG
ncbi:hypothetical protein ASD25_12610 [Brevundimonas sp. Root1423]|nr:hypothetical protein ASD25_12610 [Brevundimonas sp. Root1423]